MTKNISNNDIYIQISEWLKEYHSDICKIEKERVKTLIVTGMYPIIKHIAKTIARRSYDPVEDMVQAGFIGLLKAIDKYDINRNDNFRIYAGYLIIGEMKHYLRDKLNTIKVPRHIQELSVRIYNFTQNLTEEELQLLTTEDVANALEVSSKSVDAAMMIDRRQSTLSLDAIYKMNEDSLSYEEVISSGNYEEQLKYEDARITFENAINKLPDEEKVLIDMYYKQDMTQKEIANALLLSPMKVSRKLKQAFATIAKLVAEGNQIL